MSATTRRWCATDRRRRFISPALEDFTSRSWKPSDLRIVQEVLAQLADGTPLEQTLELVTDRLAGLAGFDFCGVLVPDDDWQSLHLAGAYHFPPEFASHLNEIFLVPVADDTLVGSPTHGAMREGQIRVVNDAFRDPTFEPWRYLAERFRYRAVVSVPLVVDGQTIGVLNGYSATPRNYSAEELFSIEILASQAAVALRVATLVEERRETIQHLKRANDDLEYHQSVLERAHEIHVRLTTAVIEGSDSQVVCQTLADLIGCPVVVADARGEVLLTSSLPDATADGFVQDAIGSIFGNTARDVRAGSDGPTVAELAPSPVVAEIRIGTELLGYVIAPALDAASRDLDVRAVQHGATVLALEIVKERVASATEERLRADFLGDLIRGRTAPEDRMIERGRHYGLELDSEHRVIVAALATPAGSDDALTTSKGGTDAARAELFQSVSRDMGVELSGSVVSTIGDTLTAIVPVNGMPDAVSVLRTSLKSVLRRSEQMASGVGFVAAIGDPVRAVSQYPEAHHNAMRCVELLRRLQRIGEVVVRDELGLLGLFVDSRRPEKLVSMAEETLGPILKRDRGREGTLFTTLQVYFDCRCDVRSTAETLYVHVNTVRYRLNRIQDLCELDLRDPEDLLKSKIAALALRLL